VNRLSWDVILKYLPTVEQPKKHVSFKSRLKWVGIVLLLYYFLGQITLYGVAPEIVERFKYLEMILGAKMGSLITLGIGPIVTASIILQLLVGAEIIPWDLKTEEGKEKFMGVQKLFSLFLTFVEAFAYVEFGAIQPINTSVFISTILILQIAFGGIIIMLLDEVVSKWGVGSGVSLFIAAGVSKTIVLRLLNPLKAAGSTVPVGLLPQIFVYLGQGNTAGVVTALMPIIATIIVLLIVSFFQLVKVEIPLAFGSFTGFSRRWPLNFIYTSNMPVILIAALLANLRLIANMLFTRGITFLGSFDSYGYPTSGFIYYLTAPSSPSLRRIMIIFGLFVLGGILLSEFLFKEHGTKIILGSLVIGLIAGIFASYYSIGLPLRQDVIRAITYTLFMGIGSLIFSIFWVQTSGMDAHSVAKQIQSIGMQIPGFRRDPRIIETVLNRYIMPLAAMGGIFVGILAAFSDFTNVLGGGIGILLTVMIISQLYEQIMSSYAEELNPAVRKFLGR